VQRYNAQGNYNDYVNDMVVDGQGNVYLTGYSNGDFLTLQYNSSGSLKWARTYDSPHHGYDKAIAIGLDKSKNVYVFGNGTNINGKDGYMTIKYSNDGNLLWMREYINSDSMGAYPYALAVDDSGNVYVTGYSYLSGNEDFCTIKYNTNGELQWVRYYGGTANIGDIPYAIAVDKKGNSYVTGAARDSGNINTIPLIKYDSLGNQKWIKKYFFQNNGYREGSKIKIDLNRNIFVGGYGIDETNTEYKFILIKYDSSGTEKWVRTYGCTSGYNPSAYLKDLTIDNNNNIYVAGVSDSSQMGWDFTTLKYNNNGDWQWIKRYRNAFNSSDGANAITVDRFNNVYVTGETDNNTPWHQYLTVKYSSDGAFNWAATYNNNISFNYNHEGIKVGTDSIGNVYVTGNSEGNGTGMDIATIKYSAPSGIRNLSNEIPKECKLYQNYPNPFNPTTNIKYQIQKSNFVEVKVYDILGKSIASLVNEKQSPGTYEVQFNGGNLPSGIYFYKLRTGDFVQVKKMLMIK
jgi:uncharacterized delta-60 repeat protein